MSRLGIPKEIGPKYPMDHLDFINDNGLISIFNDLLPIFRLLIS